MVSLKIISLYIYKDLRPLSRGWQPSSQSSVWFLFRSCFSALRPKINHFRIHQKCYFPVKFVVSLIILLRDCTKLSRKLYKNDLLGQKDYHFAYLPSPCVKVRSPGNEDGKMSHFSKIWYLSTN